MKNNIKSICIFCGSSTQTNQRFLDLAYQTGQKIAEKNIILVYGGAKVGLMGAVADGALSNKGHVIGVLPEKLVQHELAHEKIQELHSVDTMHQRKEKMSQLSDAFIALPGAVGTLEEILEQWTWAQLGYHNKPCGLLNYDHYYDDMINMVKTMNRHHFLKNDHKDMLLVEDSFEKIFKTIEVYEPPAHKWT